jgi:hypothetical protein
MEEAIVVFNEVDPTYGSEPGSLAPHDLGPAIRDLGYLIGKVHSRTEGNPTPIAGREAREAKEGWYYGFYIADKRLWFGLWTGPWAECVKGPLWLQAMDDPAKKALRPRWNRDLICWEGRMLLPVSIDGTWDDIEERALRAIAEALRLLDSTPEQATRTQSE